MSLESIGQSIWLAEGEIVSFYGFPYPTRCVVVRFRDDALWIWSPIKLTQNLRDEVSALGQVSHLVSPNKIHHLYLQEWKDAYPEAQLWGPASTIRKRSDLAFEAPLTDLPPPAWCEEIDQSWFRGSPALDEVVFFHRLSSTAIVADLSENFGEDFLVKHWSPWARTIARACKITSGYGYAPLELRLTWFNRKPARAALERVLAWEPKQVVMAHGEWQEQNGRAYLEGAFSWLLP